MHCLSYLFTGTLLLRVFTPGYKRILTWGSEGTQKNPNKNGKKKIGLKKRRQSCPSTINQWTTSQIFSPSSSPACLTLRITNAATLFVSSSISVFMRDTFHKCINRLSFCFFTTVMGKRGLRQGSRLDLKTDSGAYFLL